MTLQSGHQQQIKVNLHEEQFFKNTKLKYLHVQQFKKNTKIKIFVPLQLTKGYVPETFALFFSFGYQAFFLQGSLFTKIKIFTHRNVLC
jgi:hypothetical protein